MSTKYSLNTFKKFFRFSLLLLSFTLVVNGLRLTNMTAPVVADSRKIMELDCHFDMETEELYAVKWYKDDQEFFRYMPHQQPHVMSFPVSGVYLVPFSTDCGRQHCKLQLTKLSRHHSSGAYRCEISSEAPTFRLAAETHNIAVATLPLERPKLEGLQDAYSEGDMLEANCSSSPSDPAPILTWYINDHQAPIELLGEMRIWDTEGLVTRSVSIHFWFVAKSALVLFVVEAASFVGCYGVWSKLNTDREFRNTVRQKVPIILETYYTIGEKLGGDNIREIDYEQWRKEGKLLDK
ncbi:hypothetical protein RN001_003894 [Aquatica leii]|uniref:Ig-like domain-containing protein n=1 Tax=Aquatica leii TaxID=1421715 RepID=A0AAN7SRR4_9COLE|nr:hypothetical protein RN001_003894 [Aquatica leii]